MTLREKLELDHPECIDENQNGGCKDCPSTYGYPAEDMCDCKTCNDELCRKCWDRKYEGELTPLEKKIERLERALTHQRLDLDYYRNTSELYDHKLNNLINHIEEKSDEFINYDDADKAKSVFDKILLSRNKWRTASVILIGLIIGNIIATFLI
jgi:hypothetical protein